MHYADRDLPMGTLMHMGPGNFPAALGAILAFFGLFIAARGLWRAPPKILGRSPNSLRQAPELGAPSPWELRPVGCIVGAMAAFGFLMPRLGLLPALMGMFALAVLASRELRWREALVLTAVLSAFAVVVFVLLLKLPFQLWRGFYLA